MRTVARAALAVAVILGWTLALVWLATSVSQIAVDRVTSVSVHCACPGPSGV